MMKRMEVLPVLMIRYFASASCSAGGRCLLKGVKKSRIVHMLLLIVCIDNMVSSNMINIRSLRVYLPSMDQNVIDELCEVMMMVSVVLYEESLRILLAINNVLCCLILSLV